MITVGLCPLQSKTGVVAYIYITSSHLKHEALVQCWRNSKPAPQTMGQYYHSINVSCKLATYTANMIIILKKLLLKVTYHPLYSINKFVTNKSKLPQNGARVFPYMGWFPSMWPSERVIANHPIWGDWLSCDPLMGDRSPLRRSRVQQKTRLPDLRDALYFYNIRYIIVTFSTFKNI